MSEAETHIMRVVDLIHRTVREGYNDPAIRAEERSMAAEYAALPDADKDRLAADWRPCLIAPTIEPDIWRRAAIGRLMALIGRDDRKGVGLGADGLPDIDWIEIPEGEFIYQDDECLALPTYYISRYPLTFAQYQPFLDAEDGFCDPRWWEGLPDDKYRAAIQSEPKPPAFPLANVPRDEVSWFEMIAFSRWLSHRWGGSSDLDDVMQWKVRLPSDQEWEKAARGTDGRRFPWGDEYISGYANIDETDHRDHMKGAGKVGPYFLNGPTAVGLYPQGASPYGAMDMIGNVWEITLTDFRSGRNDDLRDPYVARTMRGAPWFVQVGLAHITQRFSPMQFARGFDVGFRLATSQI